MSLDPKAAKNAKRKLKRAMPGVPIFTKRDDFGMLSVNEVVRRHQEHRKHKNNPDHHCEFCPVVAAVRYIS
jgi:hypothetical protein